MPGQQLTPGEARKKNRRFFDAFWSVFPKKQAINDAERVFSEVVEGTPTRPGVDPQYLIERAQAYARTVDPKDLKYVPAPASWLRSGRYEDADLFSDQRDAEMEWLRQCWRDANVTAVEDKFRITFEYTPPPDGMSADEIRVWHREVRRAWISEQRKRIV